MMSYMIRKKPKRLPYSEISRYYHPEVKECINYLYESDFQEDESDDDEVVVWG